MSTSLPTRPTPRIKAGDEPAPSQLAPLAQRGRVPAQNGCGARCQLPARGLLLPRPAQAGHGSLPKAAEGREPHRASPGAPGGFAPRGRGAGAAPARPPARPARGTAPLRSVPPQARPRRRAEQEGAVRRRQYQQEGVRPASRLSPWGAKTWRWWRLPQCPHGRAPTPHRPLPAPRRGRAPCQRGCPGAPPGRAQAPWGRHRARPGPARPPGHGG